MQAPSIKVLKTAITIMTGLIILGLILLVYGVSRKSAELMETETQPQPPVVTRVATPLISTTHLSRDCGPILVAVEQRTLIFGSTQSTNPDCPVAVIIDRENGALIQTLSVGD